MSPLIAAALDAYRRTLAERFGDRLERVALFGSWARNDAAEDSDVDIAVIVDELTGDEWKEAVRLAADIEVEFDLPISAFVVSTERFRESIRTGGIGAEIEREGIAR